MTQEIKRFTVDLETEDHSELKYKCARTGLTMAYVIRKLVSLWINNRIPMDWIKESDEPRKTAP